MGPKSKYCLALVTLSLRPLAEFCSSCWICQSCNMNFAKLLHGFVKIDVWISLGCYTWICQCCCMDLSMLLRGFLKVNTWTFQSHFMPCLHCLWNCFVWIFKKEMSKTHWSWEWKCFHFWNWKIPKSFPNWNFSIVYCELGNFFQQQCVFSTK